MWGELPRILSSQNRRELNEAKIGGVAQRHIEPGWKGMPDRRVVEMFGDGRAHRL